MRPEWNETMDDREAWEIIEVLREISDELKAIREIMEPCGEEPEFDEADPGKYIL